MPRYIGIRLGSVTTKEGDSLAVEATLETMPSVLFDAVAIPGGKKHIEILGNVGHVAEFIKDQYRHAKPILALRECCDLVENAQAAAVLPSGEPDPGMLIALDGSAQQVLQDFVEAIAKHRHHEREMDPPGV